jgi:hypothetical protein
MLDYGREERVEATITHWRRRCDRQRHPYRTVLGCEIVGDLDELPKSVVDLAISKQPTDRVRCIRDRAHSGWQDRQAAAARGKKALQRRDPRIMATALERRDRWLDRSAALGERALGQPTIASSLTQQRPGSHGFSFVE